MAYQDLRKIYKLTPEQLIFVNWFYSVFNSGAAGRRIVNVEPLFYQGAIAGSEFLVYDALKLYICLNSKYNYSVGNATTAYMLISLFNELNVTFFYISNNYLAWDVTAAAFKFTINTKECNNYYFSRFSASAGVNSMIFNGFRITLI